jgi:hypothetical protein
MPADAAKPSVRPTHSEFERGTVVSMLERGLAEIDWKDQPITESESGA